MSGNSLYISAAGEDAPGHGQSKDKPARSITYLRGKIPGQPHDNWLVPGTTIYVMSDYDLDVAPLNADPTFAQTDPTTAPTLSSVVSWPGAKADTSYVATSFAQITESGSRSAPIRIMPFGRDVVSIVGNGRGRSVGISLMGTASYVTIERLRFSGFRQCIFVNSFNPGTLTPTYESCHHILIRHCVFERLTTTPTTLFDLMPSEPCAVNGTGVFTSARTHHVSIIDCKFIDLWYNGPLPAQYWHLLSAIHRDSKGRIYHRVTDPNNASWARIVRRATWGPFTLEDPATETIGTDHQGVLDAPLFLQSGSLTPAGLDLCADLKAESSVKALTAVLQYSPNHWFQHAHSVYAQGYEILIRNCYFNFNSLTWHIKIDGNFGTSRWSKKAAAVGVNALTPEPGAKPEYYFFDMLPDKHSQLKADYGVDSAVAGPAYQPSDFPGGNTDDMVRTHRIENNIFDAWNSYTSEKYVKASGLQPAAETTAHMIDAVMAADNLKPHFSYDICTRWANLVVVRNSETMDFDMKTGLPFTAKSRATAVKVTGTTWSPMNVLICDNVFIPPSPWQAPTTTAPTGNGTAAVFITTGVWGSFVNVPVKDEPLPPAGAQVGYVLAMAGTEFAGNVVLGPWGKPNQLSNVFRFYLMNVYMTDKAGNISGLYTQGGAATTQYGNRMFLDNGYPGAPGSVVGGIADTFQLPNGVNWWPTTWDPGVDPFAFYHLAPLTAAAMTTIAPLTKSPISNVAQYIGPVYGLLTLDLTQQLVKPKKPNYFWSFG